MKLRTVFLILMLAAWLPACNQSLAEAPTQLPTAFVPLLAVTTQTPLPPTATQPPLPSSTFTVSPTMTSAVPMISASAMPVNCRYGPGLNYIYMGAFNPGLSVPILGRDATGSWWQIQDPGNSGYRCWVSESTTTVTGDTTNIPVAELPQTYVIGLVANKIHNISVPTCSSPIPSVNLTGVIEVNGPTKVTWHFETDLDGDLPWHTVNFTTFGPHAVSQNDYTPPSKSGSHWIRLVVNLPNVMVAQSDFQIGCP
jgi:uncharacterized protein YraI